MNMKFAILSYVESRNEISLKYKILRKAPAKVFEWYIYKFNPYKMEDVMLMGEEGYHIKLPILKEAAYLEPEKALRIVNKTIESLMDYNVMIILPPEGPEIVHKDNISIALGRDIFPFFLKQGIKKALKTVRKDIKNAEILVIAGGEFTESVIYSIYEEINYLSVMVGEEDRDRYTELTEDIFGDNGLNIQIISHNKTILSTADIVINAGEMDESFFYSFKRGAVIFDLNGECERRRELMRKREDLLVVDDFRLRCGEQMFSLADFELLFYVKSKEFRVTYLRGYDIDIAKKVEKKLDELEVIVTAFKSLDNIINTVSINKFLKYSVEQFGS